MHADHIVKVTVNYCGKDKEGFVGYSKVQNQELIDGVWTPTTGKYTVFGYVDNFGRMTHMSYALNTSGVDSWEIFAVTDKYARKHDSFYFDAGGNGRPLFIHYRELQRAMHELGLISDDAVKYCKQCKHSKLIHPENEEHRGACSKIVEETDGYLLYCPCAVFQEVGDESKKEDDAP